MKIVVATDIHGITDQIRVLFQNFGADIQFLSPWDGDGCPYETEQEAVTAFHAEHGLIAYQQKIAHAAGDVATFFIGFSVGASSLWLHTASEYCHPNSQAHLYYGSRIRDHLSIIPRCPTSLIFAEHESSFHPSSIAAHLHNTAVTCKIIQATRHGFMNPHTRNFDPAQTQQQLAQMQALYRQCAFD